MLKSREKVGCSAGQNFKGLGTDPCSFEDFEDVLSCFNRCFNGFEPPVLLGPRSVGSALFLFLRSHGCSRRHTPSTSEHEGGDRIPRSRDLDRIRISDSLGIQPFDFGSSPCLTSDNMRPSHRHRQSSTQRLSQVVRSGDLVKASDADFVVIKRGPQCNLCNLCSVEDDDGGNWHFLLGVTLLRAALAWTRSENRRVDTVHCTL